ncbi:MAG: putative LPS assembly protein LptD [Gemmatimonadota bacterium]
MRAVLLLCIAVCIAPALLSAQVRPPGRPGVRDTVPRDSTGRDSAAWLPADATMRALLAKPGYIVTRYEGDVVSFDANTNAFAVQAAATQRAQVERDGQRVDTDSTIVYRDRHVDVNGRFRMVAGGGQPPVAGFGSASYDLAARSGRLTNAELTLDESGAKWFVKSDIGKTALGDSARKIPTRFYGLGGTLTSCEDSIPDYFFKMKEIKRTDRTLVARPAVMYIRDIPVIWLPFVFQDIRSGRRSGVLPPRFGVSDIVRNSPNYRRHVENVGYYWAPTDYVDFATWVDWRSTTGGDSLDPGWYKANLEWRYNWAARFLSGGLATSYQRTNRGSDNTQISWNHQQRIGERSFNANVNYVTSTQLQRQNTFNTYQAMSTIRSSFNYSDHIGPAKLQLGGGRTQYPGRRQVDQDLPKFSITSPALALFSWLTWTPAFSYSETSRLHMDSPWQFTQRFVADSAGRLVRADSINRGETDRNISFDTPLRIFKYEFRSGVRIHDWIKNYPEQRDVYINADTGRRETRVFQRQYGTEIDWNPAIAMPSLNQNRFKITPSVSLSNVDPHPYWVRSYLSGGGFVAQSKRLSYGLSASPTIFGVFPGLGPFERFRHSISPTLSYSIAPRARISDEYLAAIGAQKQRYLGTLPQSAITFGLSHNVEAKVRSPADSGGADATAQKLKLVSMQFSSISYDFERAKASGRKLGGLTTENFGTRLSSDLLPGMDFSFDYSLFRGSTITDTAEFSPFLTHVASTLRFSNRENPFTIIGRLFARPDQRGALSRDSAASRQEESGFARQSSQQVAGQGSRGSHFYVPPVDGWQTNLSFSMSRQRPPRPGDQVLSSDPRVLCQRYVNQPFAYDQCYSSPSEVPVPSPYGGGPQIIGPPQINVSGDLRFRLTQKWSATWNSSFDFVQHQFASQVVTLQRDLHDWTSVFAFTRSSNGNFAFTFNIALKPQPDLKFDYSKASIRSR